MSSLYEGAVIILSCVLVFAVIAAGAVLGGFLSLLGVIFLIYLGIKAVLEL